MWATMWPLLHFSPFHLVLSIFFWSFGLFQAVAVCAALRGTGHRYMFFMLYHAHHFWLGLWRSICSLLEQEPRRKLFCTGLILLKGPFAQEATWVSASVWLTKWVCLCCPFDPFWVLPWEMRKIDASNYVELHGWRLMLVWKWCFCKQTFLSQESMSLQEHFAHSAACHQELRGLSKRPWEMLPAEDTVNRQLHPRFLKTPMLWHGKPIPISFLMIWFHVWVNSSGMYQTTTLTRTAC